MSSLRGGARGTWRCCVAHFLCPRSAPLVCFRCTCAQPRQRRLAFRRGGRSCCGSCWTLCGGPYSGSFLLLASCVSAGSFTLQAPLRGSPGLKLTFLPAVSPTNKSHFPSIRRGAWLLRYLYVAPCAGAEHALGHGAVRLQQQRPALRAGPGAGPRPHARDPADCHTLPVCGGGYGRRGVAQRQGERKGAARGCALPAGGRCASVLHAHGVALLHGWIRQPGSSCCVCQRGYRRDSQQGCG
jgi:hypothetical protein